MLVTARYSTGWPARFHVVPPWDVEADLAAGFRSYGIGGADVTADMIHIRYQSRVGDAHGHGPLKVAGPRLVAASALARYAQQYAASGGIPNAVLIHPDDLTAAQAYDLQSQWVNAPHGVARVAGGAVGRHQFQDVAVQPGRHGDGRAFSLDEEARIAVLLGMPPFLVGLPSGGDSMTYSNTTALFDYHWRAGLRPMAAHLMSDLSGRLLPAAPPSK